jgi:hypothetical protein
MVDCLQTSRDSVVPTIPTWNQSASPAGHHSYFHSRVFAVSIGVLIGNKLILQRSIAAPLFSILTVDNNAPATYVMVAGGHAYMASALIAGKLYIIGMLVPLCISADGNYEEAHDTLAPGDRLTFVSDGVVEATNARRELYGFERTRAISNQPAAEIADAAKQFGQEDDITVLSVTLTAKLQEITA